MISVPKSRALVATKYLFPTSKPVATTLSVNKSKNKQTYLPNKGGARLPTSPVSACVTFAGPNQVRFAHTDISQLFKTEHENSIRQTDGFNHAPYKGGHSAFTYFVGGVGLTASIFGGKKIVHELINIVSITQDVLALAKVEINLDEIPEGKSMQMKWRGKPLFVRHRTPDEISTEESVDLAELRDPQTDSDRASDPRFLVVIGVCTHLGCIPLQDAGDFGGYFCPCHGSHYDASGRIRKGPAPLNLQVPNYVYSDETTLVVG